MKKVMFLIVAVIVLLVGWLILRDRSEDKPAVSETPSLTVSPMPSVSQETTGRNFDIIISPDGVSAHNLMVKAGDRVTFINQDSILHWPAAGTHPTHNLCPGFDALKGLKQGESYAFTFNETGICPFHDHLKTGDSRFDGIIEISGGK